MAKISKENIYNRDTTYSDDDSWVGSDSQDNKKTKTYTLGAVAEYVFDKYELTSVNGVLQNTLLKGDYFKIENYDYFVFADKWVLDNVIYQEHIEDTVTLSPADPTNDRFDIIVIGIDKTISVIEGTPDANPSKPTIDPALYLEVGLILVQAGTTEDGEVVEQIIYDENTQQAGGEFDTVAVQNAVLDSTISPKQGTNHILLPAGGSVVNLNKTGYINISEIDKVILHVRKVTDDYSQLTFTFKDTNGTVSEQQGKQIALADAVNAAYWNFNTGFLSDYQVVVIPASFFSSGNFSISRFNQVRIVKGGNIDADTYLANCVYYIDKIYTQKGTPVTGNEELVIPDRTSQLINDGEDSTSTFVEHDELGNVATSNDYNDLDNKPTIPANTSDLTNDSLFINEQSLPTNVLIKGVQLGFPTKASLINLIKKTNGTNFTTGEIDLYIKNWSLVSDTIEFLINIDYHFQNDIFRPTFTGENLTHYYDYGGRCKSLGNQAFLSNINVQVLYFPEVEEDISTHISNNTALLTAYFPRANGANFIGCTNLNSLNVERASTLSSLQNCSSLPTTIPLITFRYVTTLTGQDCFKGTPVQNVEFPELISLDVNTLRDATSMVSFKAPKLQTIGGGAFRNANNITELNFPLCTSVGNSARTFEMDGITLINLPNCKIFGDDAIDNQFFVGATIPSGAILIVNKHLKTSNGGAINANVQAAIGAGFKVIYADDTYKAKVGYTVATLPSGTLYDEAYVTDATTTTFGSIVAGSGSNIVPVYYNGTNWIIG